MGSCLLLECISRVVSAHKSPSPSGTAGFVLSLLGMIECRHRVNRLSAARERRGLSGLWWDSLCGGDETYFSAELIYLKSTA